MLIIKGICFLPDFYFRQNIACVNTLTVTAVSGVIAQYLLQMFLAVATQAILHVVNVEALPTTCIKWRRDCMKSHTAFYGEYE